MPVRKGHDSEGTYYKVAHVNKKYYYIDETSRKKAKHDAIIQEYAIKKTQEKKKIKIKKY